MSANMFSIVLEFEKCSENEDLKCVHWIAVHSFFEYIFPETFICALKPYNGNDALAKIFFKETVSMPDVSNQVKIDNHIATLVDCQTEDLTAVRTRVLRLPCQPGALSAATQELGARLKVRLHCLPEEGGGCLVAVTGCHEEVVQAALDTLEQDGRLTIRTEASGTASVANQSRAVPQPTVAPAASASAAAKPARKPLFPAALLAEESPSPRETPPTVPQQKRQLPSLHLSPSCRLIIECSDLTRLTGVDILVATTNSALSMRHGLANAVASRATAGLSAVEADCQRHLRSIKSSSGGFEFGETYLCSRGGDGFDQILFLCLPNDRRLEGSLGRGDAFRRLMEQKLDSLMKRLVRTADSSPKTASRVAMPTLGSTLPLWRSPDDWAEALAGALAGLEGRAGALAELRICCVSQDAATLLSNAVTRRLGAQPSAPPIPDAGESQRSDAAGASASSAAASSMEVEESGGDQTSPTCLLCASDFSKQNPPEPFHCDQSGQLCRHCVHRLNSTELPSDGKCVICFERYRPAVGYQPSDGRMSVKTEVESLPGFDGSKTLVISYEFGPGVQEGKQYRGTTRTAYLPDTPEGQSIVSRLKTAFAGRVVFNVGVSATTGRENAITWNTLHHKTNKSGGPTRHGYPDEGYLRRINDELSALGY